MYIKENCEPSFWKPLWQTLLDTHMYWAPTDVLKKEEQCVVDATHKYEKILPLEGTNNPVMYQQYELKENPNSDLVQFGFTEEEVRRALANPVA
jgi:hypothetical protein